MGIVHPLQIALGSLLAAIVAYYAYRLKTLDRSGAWAAFILGSIVFGFGGLPSAIVLLVFFLTSSGLSRFLNPRKAAAEHQVAKGARRDAWQVLANGGVAGLVVLVGLFFPGSPLPWVLFAAAFAAANADTWATELGVLSRQWPRSIRSWRPIPPGTSGGVSPAGTFAALAGSFLIALTAWAVWPSTVLAAGDRLGFSLIIGLAGFVGSLVDSLLGATVQAQYHCSVCVKDTEKHPLHTCGSPTSLIRGWWWMNNDVVNLVCTISSVLLTVSGWFIFV